MNDMRAVIIPKSDQMNADDLLSGSMTITVTEVSIRPGTEQPVSIHFVGDEGKPYKPCKSMARVMVHCWGPDANQYVGRSMTLYCDPKVMWGGMAVGGIRISHMTDIAGAQTMALTATKGTRKPFTIKPLVLPSTGTPKQSARQDLDGEAMAAAKKGSAEMRAFWSACTKQEQGALKPQVENLKAVADAFDRAAKQAAEAPKVDNDDPFGLPPITHDPDAGEIPGDDKGNPEADSNPEAETIGRNPMWSRDNYEIPMPADGKQQLPLWVQWFIQAAGDALTLAELMKLERDNAGPMGIVKAKRTDLYSEVRTAIKDQHTALAGAEGI